MMPNSNGKATMLPVQVLNEANTSGQGGVIKDLEGSYRTHTLAVIAQGNPTTCIVELQVSQDGEQFFNIAKLEDGTGMVTIDTHLFRYVTASLDTLEGGSSPTVTAWVASA